MHSHLSDLRDTLSANMFFFVFFPLSVTLQQHRYGHFGDTKLKLQIEEDPTCTNIGMARTTTHTAGKTFSHDASLQNWAVLTNQHTV